MKKLLKFLIVTVLGWQTRRLYKKNHFVVVAVVGSMGKTSTKNAIAQTLSNTHWVRYQEGNYNDIVTVPLVIFGEKLPQLTNPLAWVRLLLRNERTIAKPYEFDVVVLELGTDGPGQISKFKKYLTPDYAVATAIVPEHMEFFGNLESVAKEELSVQNFSKNLLINADLCPSDIEKYIKVPYQAYGQNAKNFRIGSINRKGWQIISQDKPPINIKYPTISNAQIYSLTAATIIASSMGVPFDEIQKAIEKIKPVSGRMNVLVGKDGSTIIDDTYNASPDAVLQALEALDQFPGRQKIALLGNMNELGESSAKLHAMVGERCNPQTINLIVTLGKDANEHLAKAAEDKGCKVIRTKSPYEAGQVILNELKPQSVILAKGSQNGVYAEEAVKLLLANPNDAEKLVRQSEDWLVKKKRQFRNSE